MANSPKSPKRRNDVGYGRPPVEHRFQPGRSGNPKGRPKGSKNAQVVLTEILNRKVAMRVNGNTKRISFLEAMLLRFAEDALKGNTKSAAFLLGRYQNDIATGETEETFSQNDEKLINDFLEQAINKRIGK